MKRMLGFGRPPLKGAALLAVAAFGLATAIGFAVSPVTQEGFAFEFRPADSEAAGRAAVAPFAIARRAPDAIELTLPCDIPGSRFRSSSVDLWVSDGRTIRSPLPYGPIEDQLVVAVTEGEVAVTLGDADLLRASIEHSGGCAALIRYEDPLWSLRVEGQEVFKRGSGPRFGEATFSGPAAGSVVSSIRVETRAVGSSPTLLQVVLLVVTLGTVAVVAGQLGRVRSAVRVEAKSSSFFSRLRRSIRTVDIGVVAMLVVWAFLIPAFFDDGWLWARQRDYSTQGAFTEFYTNSFSSPLGYWWSWVQHLWIGLSSAPIVARVLPVVIGAATWLGIRGIGRRLSMSAQATWVMAAVFVVGSGAWGMTWRSEPIIAALAVASLALAVRFSSGERGPILVAWPLVIALGVTAHPAGVVVAAPLLASWKSLVAWVRSNRQAALTALTLVGLMTTLAVLLFFMDSNLDVKLESIDAAALDPNHQGSVFDELARYRLLNGENGTVMRRTAVSLMLAGVLAFILSSGRSASNRLGRLPGWSLVWGLLLLTLTPSKWEWHWGALVGFAALVAALELGRRRSPGDAAGIGRSRAVAAAMTGGLGAAMAWSWSTDTQWAPFDLRTQKWWQGAVNLFPFDLSSPVVWAGVIAVVWAALAVRDRWRPGSRDWSLPSAVALVASGLVIVVTGATLALDVVRTDGWTFGRQNLASLWGGAGCGLAGELAVPARGSLHQLNSSDDTSEGADDAAAALGFTAAGVFQADGFPVERYNAALPLAGMAPIVGSWVSLDAAAADTNRGGYRSPWHAIEPTDDVVALTIMGSFEPRPDEGRPDERWSKNAVAVQWGVQTKAGIQDHGVDQADLDSYFVDWSLITFSPPAGADRVRLLLLDDSSGGEAAWIASSQPLGASLGAFPERGAMITPPLVPYFPCVDTPSFKNARVMAPSILVLRNDFWQTVFALAASSDRYFDLRVEIPPGRARDSVVIAVSQEYLTGSPARANGEFVGVDP